MNTYLLTIITPSGKIFEEQITSLIAPGIDGLFGIMAHHAHMVVQLVKGILQVKSQGTEHFFVIDSGVLEVDSQSNVLILADTAVTADSLKDAKTATV